ncbi:MAG: hypothetical protein ACJ0BR_00325 [Candidatus Puniceispirillales bacterium]|jgi:ApbE superfamily uncharacterized protein (UPF0280 family)|tara:strand:- start:3865 stop:4719 length:855 start_codon:yes stop_codon:yes gene_type:complete
MFIKEQDNRLFLQHGPINIVLEALGIDRSLAYTYAKKYFETLLDELVLDQQLLKKKVVLNRKFNNKISQSMQNATEKFIPSFITPMAAVAGSIADNILRVVINNTNLEKAYVNNGGDVSFYLNKNQIMKSSLAAIPNMIAEIKYKDKSRGIATSGWRGKSFSRGIADSVTVLANNAAMADAAATMICNAVDIYDHPNIKKKPANEIYEESDLNNLLITVEVGELTKVEIKQALKNGYHTAMKYVQEDLINTALIQISDFFCIVQKNSTDLNIINKSKLKKITYN